MGRILKNINPDEVVFITCRNFQAEPERRIVKNIVDISIQTLHIMLEEIFMKDLRECIRINDLVRQAKEQGAVLKKNQW